MNITELWRSKLNALIEEYGGPKPLADHMAQRTPSGKTILTPNLLTQLKSPKKSFGKKIAEEIERRAGKPKGWMNEPLAPTVDAEVQSHNDTVALQLALNSMITTLVARMPGIASEFASVLRYQAGEMKFSTETAGFVKEALRIVERGQRKAEAVVVNALQRDAARRAS